AWLRVADVDADIVRGCALRCLCTLHFIQMLQIRQLSTSTSRHLRVCGTIECGVIKCGSTHETVEVPPPASCSCSPASRFPLPAGHLSNVCALTAEPHIRVLLLLHTVDWSQFRWRRNRKRTQVGNRSLWPREIDATTPQNK
ncbi:unnamed protein product, partial [Laminaria digitata]